MYSVIINDMKILLVGEYSGLFTYLRDGFIALGHEVVLAAGDDGFKSLKSDIQFGKYGEGFKGKIKTLISLINNGRLLVGFDKVLLINAKFTNNLAATKLFYNYLIKNNSQVFLTAAGDDSLYFEYWLRNSYSEFEMYFADIQKYDGYNHATSWGNKKTIDWNRSLAKRVTGIIPIMYEYHKPYSEFFNCYKSLPIPINVDKVCYSDNRIIDNKLVVFHGLNRYGAKGTNYVKEAFDILRRKYPQDLELIIDGKMSFEKYQEVLKRTNVVVDQTHSFSLAMNALISMAMGKVVLGGAASESFIELGYEFNPAINITSDPDSIVKAIEFLLENRSRVPEIGYQSRLFVETHHHYISVAQKYLEYFNRH